MKAAIYNPYLDTLGGGERYTMTVAQTLCKNGWDVDVEWNDLGILKKLEERFGLNLSGVRVVSTVQKGSGYDAIFWVSDGSIPDLNAKKNILHFQIPFHDVGGGSVFNWLKIKKIKEFVCNSKFTKYIVDKEYGIDGLVIYPPVDVNRFKKVKKENIILAVGRFSQLLQAKRQDILVSVFKKMVDDGLKGWKLILAGGSDVGGKDFISMLKPQIKKYSICIVENPTNPQLTEFYEKAKIFWSASGYGINEKYEPEKLEHFGITTVEAMAAGAVPIVYGAGGAKEIIQEEVSGFCWNNQDELIEKTIAIVKNERRKKFVENARKASRQYGIERFEREIMEII